MSSDQGANGSSAGRCVQVSAIDSALVQAYRETRFEVTDIDPPFTLQIGARSQPLAALHVANGAVASSFVTACNPHSELLGPAANADRHERLRKELQALRLVHLGGHGWHPGDQWTAEASFLVLGIDLGAASDLGRRWDQNAIVWAGVDAVPQLVLLR